MKSHQLMMMHQNWMPQVRKLGQGIELSFQYWTRDFICSKRVLEIHKGPNQVILHCRKYILRCLQEPEDLCIAKEDRATWLN